MDGRGGVLAYRDDGQARASPASPVSQMGVRRPRGIRWIPALAYGLGVAMLGGVGWGIVAVASGYIFCLGGLVIGATVAWAVRKGAGRVTAGVIVLAAGLTELSIFLGDIVALSIIGSRLGLTVLDVIALYPALVAQSPGETLVAYVFGLAGVGAATQYLWGEMRAERLRSAVSRATPVPSAVAPPAAGAVSGEAPWGGVEAHVVQSGTFRIKMQVLVEDPPHVLQATYNAVTGGAKVLLDGRLAKRGIVVVEKVLEVSLGGRSTRTLGFRFYSSMGQPSIEVRMDGRLVATS